MLILPTSVGKKLLDLYSEVGQFFCLRISNYYFVARPLTISESDSIESLENMVTKVAIQDWICEKAVIYASCGLECLLSSMKAGYAQVLSEAILARSVVKDDKEFFTKLNNAREKSKELDNYVETALTSTLGANHSRNIPISKYIDNIARTELIKGQELIQINKGTKRAPPIPKGYSSTMVHPNFKNADKVTPELIEEMNKELSET